jgi:hypothetical protein
MGDRYGIEMSMDTVKRMLYGIVGVDLATHSCLADDAC